MQHSKSNLYYFSLGVIITIGLVIFSITLFMADNTTNANSNPNEDFPQGYKIISPEIPAYLNLQVKKSQPKTLKSMREWKGNFFQTHTGTQPLFLRLKELTDGFQSSNRF